MTDAQKKILHMLRNPWGYDIDQMRGARLAAANELERLWALEDQLRHVVQPALTETRE